MNEQITIYNEDGSITIIASMIPGNENTATLDLTTAGCLQLIDDQDTKQGG